MSQQFSSIDEALESIDFHSIAEAMRILGWSYGLTSTPVSVKQLKQTVLELYNNLTPVMNKTVSCSSGGFTVSLVQYEDAPELIGVQFTISGMLILKDN